MSCASSKVEFWKNEKYVKKVDLKKVITLSVYDLEQEKVLSEDPVLQPFEAIVAKKVSDIYGSLIPGGIIVSKAAQKLKIEDEINKALKLITEVSMKTRDINNGGGIGFEVLSKLATELGVDAFAIPLAYGNYENLKTGKQLEIGIVIFDAHTLNWQYVSAIAVKMSPVLRAGFGKDEAKFKKVATTYLADAGNTLMKEVSKQAESLK